MNRRETERDARLPLALMPQAVDFLMHHSCTSLRGREPSSYPFSASELLDTKACRSILSLQASQLGEPESAVVGTLFAKRYSVFCMGLLGALSLFDLQLASAPEHVRFRVTTAAAMEYETKLADSARLRAESSEERKVYVMAYSSALQQHLELIFQSIAACTGANAQVMWSLISHNVQAMYARIIHNPLAWQTEERLRLVKLDRDTLFEAREGNKLALKLRCFENPSPEEEPLLLRRHCCLSYKIIHQGKSEGYCLTCPKLSSEERGKMLRHNN